MDFWNWDLANLETWQAVALSFGVPIWIGFWCWLAGPALRRPDEEEETLGGGV